MKKVFKKVLIFLAVNLILSPQFGLAAQNNPDSSRRSQTQNAFPNAPALQVIPAQTTEQASALNWNEARPARCDFPSWQDRSSFAQGQLPVDLHQPAGCFELVPGKAESLAYSLEVRPLLAGLGQRIISLPAIRMTGVFYAAGGKHSAQSSAALPAAVALWVMAAASSAGQVLKIKKSFGGRIKSALSLQELQVLRC